MPTLSSFFSIYTDGPAPRSDIAVPRGLAFSLAEMGEVVLPTADTDLFGPHAVGFPRITPKRGFLISMQHETRGSAGTFFAEAHKTLSASVKGLRGWGFDILRLWPFPLHALHEMPDDPFAEDLLSVAFREQGEHGFRAETYGLAKLGQRELSFAFHGRELLEEAAMLCAHLGDYAMTQVRRVEHRQTMSFGFDKLLFLAAEGEQTDGPFRGWHPPLVQRLLPESLFPGVGVLEVQGFASPSAAAESDVSGALRRAYDQRLVLEEHDLAGESPHQSTTARACACAGGPDGLRAERHEPQSVKDSGWRFSCGKTHSLAELGTSSVGAFALRFPFVLRYLALPPGCKVAFNGERGLVDASRAKRDEDDTLG